jgi:hypothetical protein
MTDDPVAAFLADVRMQAEDHHLVPGADALRLAAALEAVLGLAADWKAEPVPSASHAGSVRAAHTLQACGDALELVISAALPGEAAPSPHHDLPGESRPRLRFPGEGSDSG